MKRAPSREWEDRCRRCGRCCYEKIEFEGEVFYTGIPCEKLDPVTRLCTVYPARHRLRPGCAPLTPRIVARGILPADCPYVQGIENYPAPRLWPEDEEESPPSEE